MTPEPLNLLRYPEHAQVFRVVQLKQLVGGLLAGAVIGGTWTFWQQERHDRQQVLRTQLQSAVRAQESLEARQANEREQARIQGLWIRRAQSWHREREQQLELYSVLTDQALHSGLRVERWQGDGHKMVLQAWLPRTESVPVVLGALSQAWPPGWSLHSLSDRPDAGVNVVMQAPWPVAKRLDDAGKP